jgi:hypothetical protein
MRVVRALRPHKSALFLFNVSDRILHGVYEATCQGVCAPASLNGMQSGAGAGAENINPTAWARNKQHSRSSPFPAQIEFKIVHQVCTCPLQRAWGSCAAC